MDSNGDNHVEMAEFKKILNTKLKSFFSNKKSDLINKAKQNIIIDRWTKCWVFFTIVLGLSCLIKNAMFLLN